MASLPSGMAMLLLGTASSEPVAVNEVAVPASRVPFCHLRRPSP
ncbi:MAG: hypothetical protein QM749_11935 [Aquabacterium sp.]